MKILLTNRQLRKHTGTEIYTYTLAKSLIQRGHIVKVYSAYTNEISKDFEEIGTQIVTNLKEVKGPFDIAHVHHNINAYEVRNKFPNLPIAFMSHGVLPFLEQPPLINIGISIYLAVSEAVQSHLMEYGILKSGIKIIRNLVDEDLFSAGKPINVVPQKALVISNKIDKATEYSIRQACQQQNIDCRFIGARFECIPNRELPHVIRQNDIVFSLGRGVIEAMFCGRVPIILDYMGGEGMVTPENFFDLIKNNFSENPKAKRFSVNQIINEIEKYQQDFGCRLREYAVKEFSTVTQTEKLEKVYSFYSQKKVPEIDKSDAYRISSFCESIIQTRYFCKAATQEYLYQNIGGESVFRICKFFGKLRNMMVPGNSRREKILKYIHRIMLPPK